MKLFLAVLVSVAFSAQAGLAVYLLYAKPGSGGGICRLTTD